LILFVNNILSFELFIDLGFTFFVHQCMERHRTQNNGTT